MTFIAGPSYASPVAALDQIGCAGQGIQPAGNTAYCPPAASQGPVHYEAMIFSHGALPMAYLSDHPAEFSNAGVGVVYGPNWFIAMWSTFGSSLVARVVHETAGTLWQTGDYGSNTVCQEVPRLDLFVVHQTDGNPQLNLPFPFPTTVTVAKPSLVQAVAKAMCALPPVRPGVYHSPADIGLDYNLSFSTKAQYFSAVLVPATGCQWVDLGPTRSVT